MRIQICKRKNVNNLLISAPSGLFRKDNQLEKKQLKLELAGSPGMPSRNFTLDYIGQLRVAFNLPIEVL